MNNFKPIKLLKTYMKQMTYKEMKLSKNDCRNNKMNGLK